MKEWKKDGSFTKDPRQVLKDLLNEIRQVIPETPLERKMRKKWEFESLEQGNRSQFDFHVRFQKALTALKEIDAIHMDEDELFTCYVKKLTQNLRHICVTRK